MSNSEIANQRDTNNLREKIIRYKRIIIQLIVIIAGLILIGIAIWGLKDEEQKDLKINFISSAAGLIAAAIISIADYFFLKKDEDAEVSQTINDLIGLKEKLDDFICGTKGIKLHSNRNDLMLVNKIQEAQDKICIYVTNLDFLSNHFSDLINAARRGVLIKILGLKPTNLFIATRFHELSKANAQSFFDEIKVHLVQLREQLQQVVNDQTISDRFKVKLYISQPTHMIFWFDNSLIVSFILRQGRAREQIHIEFDLLDSTISDMADDFVKDFNLIWNEATDLTSEFMQQLAVNYDLNQMEAQGINGVNTYRLVNPNLVRKGKPKSKENR